MNKIFSESVINEILDRSNIVDLISSYLPLKRVGRSYKAPCPFHPEKTPSFIVSLEKQIFHCFGCGIGGNAITFIMQYEKMNFREALEVLAQRSGIPLPAPEMTSQQKSKEDYKKNIYTICEHACHFFHKNLFNTQEANNARLYLNNRGISKKTAQDFKLGFAMPDWSALIDHLKTKGIQLSMIEKTGLSISKESGGFYDRFRNRIMFPITDIKDQIIGFGGRVLDQTLPKYVNSPETQIYSKGKNLFGLHVAKEHIRKADCAIVVEGYLDMIIPFDAGIKNIIASLGTALTIDQIRLIKRYTNNITMLYDADLAGQIATLRTFELFLEEDMNATIASLPKGHDPDSFLRQFGKEEFLKLIENAQSIFDYKLQYLCEKHNPGTSVGKKEIILDILPMIKKFHSHTLRSEYIRKTSQKLDVDEKALFEDLKNTTANTGETQRPDSIAISNYQLTEIPITERMLVKLMLEEMHLIDQLRTIIEPSDFLAEPLRKIVEFIFNFFSEGKIYKPNILMNYLGDDKAITLISELTALEIHDGANREKLIEDCVKRLKKDKINHLCEDMQKQIQTAQKIGDEKILNQLISQYSSLLKQRSQVYGKTCN
ncbi:MAG: DNA primase [Candidatus Omnitrophota bacterium]